MTEPRRQPLVAVDVGNSRIKLGLFDRPAAARLPTPSDVLTLSPDDDWAALDSWVGGVPSTARWWIASVHRPSAARLLESLGRRAIADVKLLAWSDLPLQVALAQPERVGIDRLADAVAVNRLRPPGQPAVAIDVGSAITVDLVSAEGAFLGGALFPGIRMAARALHEWTDLLPRLDVDQLAVMPPALGTSTEAAIRAGLFWGSVGAMRELVKKLSSDAPNAAVFLTGGAAPAVAELLIDNHGHPATYVPHLTLAGIAIAATGIP